MFALIHHGMPPKRRDKNSRVVEKSLEINLKKVRKSKIEIKVLLMVARTKIYWRCRDTSKRDQEI